jgi:hypothetical protein
MHEQEHEQLLAPALPAAGFAGLGIRVPLD